MKPAPFLFFLASLFTSALSATLDSIDQGASFPASSVTIKDSTLNMAMDRRPLPATCEGKVNSDASSDDKLKLERYAQATYDLLAIKSGFRMLRRRAREQDGNNP